MEIAFVLVALALGVLLGAGVARRLDVPAPLLLIAGGIAASYLPGVPELHLSHDVVLLGFLPPLLYAAALQTSLVDFNANRRPILLMSVGLVVFTTLGVGAVVHALLPGVSWGVALALGAVVAPPDAVSATAIGRRIGLPRRVVTILEGESLLNDATALVALRTAIAVTAGGVELWHVGADFAIAAGGGLLIGVLVYLLVARVRRGLDDALLDGAISLVTPFAAYLVAERLEASGVIAVVVAGLLLGHNAPVLQTAQSRITERFTWRTIAFVLENTVFLLIGLQARWILEDVGASELGAVRIVTLCAATLAAVVVLRMFWVCAAHYALERSGIAAGGEGGPAPWTHTFLLGWSGMRGVVTLAAAFVIPDDTADREILLLVAFTVVAGTLFGQGTTLPWLARRLRVPSPDPLEDALGRATVLQQASQAGLVRLEELAVEDPHGVGDLIRQRVDQRNFAAWERLSTTPGEESPSALYSRVRLEMIQAERRRVLEVRDVGRTPAEVIDDVLAMLDVEESTLDSARQERERIGVEQGSARLAAPAAAETCADLRGHPVVDTVADTGADPVCRGCLDEGTAWVALRQCLACGHVGCCDSSAGQHATAHFHETRHPVMQSAEPGEDWRWCYVHHLTA